MFAVTGSHVRAAPLGLCASRWSVTQGYALGFHKTAPLGLKRCAAGPKKVPSTLVGLKVDTLAGNIEQRT